MKKMKSMVLLLAVFGIVFSGLFMGSNKAEATWIYKKNHSHSYYGPYQIKYKGLTTYGGFLADNYGCGEKKPCNASILNVYF